MLNELKRDDIISPLAYKTTIKLYNKKMKNTIQNNIETIENEKIELFNSRILTYEMNYPRRFTNFYVFGQKTHMGACEKI